MLTKAAISECIEVARKAIETTPTSGMLKFIIDQCEGPDGYGIDEVEVVALAYEMAVRKEARP